MPLTLNCYSLGDDIVACDRTGLTLKIISQGGVGAATLTLSSATQGPLAYDALLSADYNLPNFATWIEEWETITAEFSFDETLALGRGALPAAYLSVTPLLVVKSQCADDVSPRGVAIGTSPIEIATCIDDNDGLVGLQANALGSLFSAVVYKSRPLNDCTSAGPVHITQFRPRPTATQFQLVADSGFCLFASGGDPPYQYYVSSGQLPCGLSLDDSTGCVTGTKTDACPGTSVITFLVIDSQGHQATANCDFDVDCNSPQEIGNQMF